MMAVQDNERGDRTMTYDEVFTKLNNAGLGFSVGSEGDGINEIEGIGKLIRRSWTDQEVAVYLKGDVVTLVADCNGPWAVRYEVGEAV